MLLSMYESRGDVDPMVGLVVQLAAAEWDAPVATGVLVTGVWR
jgi:hypothetical protein